MLNLFNLQSLVTEQALMKTASFHGHINHNGSTQIKKLKRIWLLQKLEYCCDFSCLNQTQKTGTATSDREDELLWNVVEKHNPQPTASSCSALIQPSKQDSDQLLQPSTSCWSNLSLKEIGLGQRNFRQSGVSILSLRNSLVLSLRNFFKFFSLSLGNRKD